MEIFRPALWMFCLVALLHAKSLKEKCYNFNLEDLGLDILHSDVSCEKSVNFTSPTYFTKQCYGAAMTSFIEELKHANMSCTDPNSRTEDILTALVHYDKPESSPTADLSECKWEKKLFTGFVEDFKHFLQQLNSIC